MASAIDRTQHYHSSGIVDPYTLSGQHEENNIPQGLPPSGLKASPKVVRKILQKNDEIAAGDDGAEGDKVYLKITSPMDNDTDMEKDEPSSSQRPKCKCSNPNCKQPGVNHVVRKDAFITPQPRILTQRVTSANRIQQPSPMSKCEAVQIVDLKVAGIDEDNGKDKEKGGESLVPLSRPGSAQPVGKHSARVKKHHVLVISREARDKVESASGARRKQMYASQSYEHLNNIAVRYGGDAKRLPKNIESAREEDLAKNSSLTTRPMTPSSPKDSSRQHHSSSKVTFHQHQEGDKGKAKIPKQVRISSAVQVYEEPETQETNRNRLVHAVGSNLSYKDTRTITRLRQEDTKTRQLDSRAKTPAGINIPEGIPQGSVVRIQHTSKGKIKVITGSEGQFTTTILEGNRKPKNGPRPPTTVDLMDDVLVITRKSSTNKDSQGLSLTSRPGSGNRAILASNSHPNIYAGRSSDRPHQTQDTRKDRSPQRKVERPHVHPRDKISATMVSGPGTEAQLGKKTIEINSPYLYISDGKGEAMQRKDNAVSLYYQNNHNQAILSARQQHRWNPEESLPSKAKAEAKESSQRKHEARVGKHQQYAETSGRYRLQAHSSDGRSRRHVTFQEKLRSKPDDPSAQIEEDYVSPTRHKWELDCDDNTPSSQESLLDRETQVAPKQKDDEERCDPHIIDAQTLAERQYYAARHKYVQQQRERERQHRDNEQKYTSPVRQYRDAEQVKYASPERYYRDTEQADYGSPERRYRDTEQVKYGSPERNTHTIVMQASSKPSMNLDPSLPPKQQLWSKETLLHTNPNKYTKANTSNHSAYVNAYPMPAPPRSPSRSRSRRRSASRSRRPNTPNTNLVADQLQDNDDDHKGTKAKLQATSSTELFEDSMYENFAHSKLRSKSRPASSGKTRPQVVDRETMVKLLHMTMPKKHHQQQMEDEHTTRL